MRSWEFLFFFVLLLLAAAPPAAAARYCKQRVILDALPYIRLLPPVAVVNIRMRMIKTSF